MATNWSTATTFAPDMATPSIGAMWETVRTVLRHECGPRTFDNWLRPITLLGIDGDTIRLALPTPFLADWVANHFLDRLRSLWTAQNPAVRHVALTVVAANDAPAATVAEPVSPALAPCIGLPLEPRYSFDSFVVGKSNELAYNAARSLADAGPVGFNPLFLHGTTGLGKTHLMHAIGGELRARQPAAKVAYLSAEKFMVDFLAALRAKDTFSFKARLRSVDLLMIDDVQFIAGKESTQEEFFHTMNEIIGAGKRLVITADRSPQNLEGIQDRILSRMAWGLVADINAADYELRLNILHAKVAGLKDQLGPTLTVPDDVIDFLARKITANVRELEGALNRTIAYARLVGKPVTIDFTRETLADLLRSHEKKVTIDDIQRRVAEYYHLKLRRPAVGAPRARGRPPPAGRDVPRQASDAAVASRDRPALRQPRPHHGDARGQADRCVAGGRPGARCRCRAVEPAARRLSAAGESGDLSARTRPTARPCRDGPAPYDSGVKPLPPSARGPAWMLVACVAFAVMWMVIRLASRSVHPFEVVFFRNVFGLAALTPMLLRRPALLDPKRALPNLRRATSGLLGTLGTFYAVANAPLATALAINYTAPLFATLGAVLFLGERIHVRRGVALAVGFVGMLVVVRPGALPLTPASPPPCCRRSPPPSPTSRSARWSGATIRAAWRRGRSS